MMHRDDGGRGDWRFKSDQLGGEGPDRGKEVDREGRA